MSKVILLSEADLRACVVLNSEVVDCIENAFRLLATTHVIMPPVLRLDIAAHNGEIDVKTAYLPASESIAVKVSPGFFDNPKLGLPSLNGMMMLLSARTGLVEAVMLDNGYLTALRTAAAGAVAARWLARPEAQQVAILGAGMQARMQLQALTLVRPIKAVTVWALDNVKAQRFAQQMSQQLQLPVIACADIDKAMAQADIAVTTTPSRRPFLEARHLRPGLHITAMGSDAEHKNEITPAAIAAATCYVCDRLSQVRVLGELHHAVAAGLIDADARMPELGEVIAGQYPGRVSTDDVTICDLTGTGVQDTAIATLAYACAVRSGYGKTFDA